MQPTSFGQLVDIAARLLVKAGLDDDKCEVVASILVEADRMGHDTHGLAQLPDYLSALLDGSLVGVGEAETLADNGIVAVWDGGWRSGVWLTAKAIDQACDRAARHGIASVAIRRSHHIACLQAYLERATARGMMAIVTCSDPSSKLVAPHGGLDPVFTPDPIGVGIPTTRDPVLIDMSSSITTSAMVTRQVAANEAMPGHWLQDHLGNLTNDPKVLKTEPRGSLLPAGGHDHGHKGYGMALMVEALSQGLSGYGRQSAEKRWGASVYVQAIDPAMFSGREAFNQQTDTIVDLCRASRPLHPQRPVRLPGQSGRTGMNEEVTLYAGIWEKISDWARRLDVELSEVRGMEASP